MLVSYLVLLLTSLVVAVVGSAPPLPARIDLFVAGAHYDITYPCYRQPAIIAGGVAATVLLAFAEGRNITACAPPLTDERKARVRASAGRSAPDPANEVGGLVLRRSLDSGAAWTSPRTIYSGHSLM